MNTIPMEIINSDQYHKLCDQPGLQKLKENEDHTPRILATPDNQIIKLFRPRIKWYHALKNSSHAERFVMNSLRLCQVGIIAPKIKTLQYCRELNIYVVIYDKLHGENIRQIAYDHNPNILHDVAKFIASLHDKGIFFRGIHLANLLQQNSSEFSIIDVTDVRFKKKSLPGYLRYRNLKHLFQNKHDYAVLQKFGRERFLDSYFNGTSSNWITKKILSALLTDC